MYESSTPIIIEGGIFTDDRGKIEFVNKFDLSVVKRMYFSSNTNTEIIRAWQGHKIESRWFYCVQGIIDIRTVAIDNWDNPSKNLAVEQFILNSNLPQVLFIPNGYANGFREVKPNSKLIIFSNYLLNEITDDQQRFDKSLWTNWNV